MVANQLSLTFESLLGFLKATSDETRLKLICILSEREYNVGELAELLELKAPTVSHHLAKLHENGLVNRDIRGNEHRYRLNMPYIERVKRNLLTEEHLIKMGQHILADNSTAMLRQQAESARAQAEAWLDDLNLSEADRKVMRDYTRAGQIVRMPTKQKKKLVILRWLATKFAPGVKYTEREVNAILGAVYHDYAELRRYLVEFGWLAREGGGGLYWRTEDEPDIVE